MENFEIKLLIESIGCVSFLTPREAKFENYNYELTTWYYWVCDGNRNFASCTMRKAYELLRILLGILFASCAFRLLKPLHVANGMDLFFWKKINVERNCENFWRRNWKIKTNNYNILANIYLKMIYFDAINLIIC